MKTLAAACAIGLTQDVHIFGDRLRVIVAAAKSRINYMFLVLPSGRSEAESVPVLAPWEMEPGTAGTMYQHDIQVLKMRN